MQLIGIVIQHKAQVLGLKPVFTWIAGTRVKYPIRMMHSSVAMFFMIDQLSLLRPKTKISIILFESDSPLMLVQFVLTLTFE